MRIKYEYHVDARSPFCTLIVASAEDRRYDAPRDCYAVSTRIPLRNPDPDEAGWLHDEWNAAVSDAQRRINAALTGPDKDRYRIHPLTAAIELSPAIEGG